jgi:biotin carboxylase
MKKLLILGASRYQLPLISKGLSLGYHVISMDNIPHNPGHRLANETAHISTVDKEAVLDFARRQQIDGIVTGASDVAVPTIGFVCDRLGLPGLSFEQAVTLTYKHRFREFQARQGLNHPAYQVFADRSRFLAEAADLTGKYILKPVDRSGSIGVTTLNFAAGLNTASLNEAFSRTMAASLGKLVILEEFIPGQEWGGDGFLHEGKFLSFCITNKYLTGEPHCVPIGHNIPCQLPLVSQNKIRAEVQRISRLLKLTEGPLNFDVIIDTKGQAFVVEMGARTGGNCLADIIYYGTGFDEIEASLQVALGKPVTSLPRPDQMIIPTGARILRSDTGGILQELPHPGDLLKKYHGNLQEIVYDFSPGDRVERFTQGSHRIGHIIVTASSLKELENLIVLLEKEI